MTSRITRASRWCAINGLFMFAAWKAVNGNDIAKNVFVILLWLFVVLSVVALETKSIVKDVQQRGRAVPVAFDIIYDLVMISGLAWYGWWWSAVGMFLIMAYSQSIYERSTK